jgi:Ca2+-binding EF-hand superfamily protein
MRKVVWTTVVAAVAVTCLAATPAAAQGRHREQRQELRARIEKRVEKRFKRLDQNGNGVIDRSEWTRKARVFDRFDRDHDGTLSPEEFRRLVIARARRLARSR